MASVPLGSEAPSAQLPVVLLCGVSDGAAAAALAAVQAFGRVAAIGPVLDHALAAPECAGGRFHPKAGIARFGVEELLG